MKTFDLKNVLIVLGEDRITGFGEDGAVSVEPASQVGEDSIGADGEVTFSRTNDDRLYVDLTVRENSIGCRLLGEKLAVQNAQPVILPLAFLLSDVNSGETLASEYAVFVQTPTISKGRSVSSRVFRLMLPNAKGRIAYAALAV